MKRKNIGKRIKRNKQARRGWVCLFTVLCFHFGCSSDSLGSIEQDNLNLTRLSAKIDEQTASGAWQMEVLQDPLPEDQCDDIYGIASDLYREVLIRRSLIEASCEEIVVFHCAEGKQEEIAAQLRQYQQRRVAEYAAMPYQVSMMECGEILEIGNYVFYVCSQDGANVIQYISSLT